MKYLMLLSLLVSLSAFSKTCRLTPTGVNTSSADWRYYNEITLDQQTINMELGTWEQCFQEAIKYSKEFGDHQELFRYKFYEIAVDWSWGTISGSGRVNSLTNPRYVSPGNKSISTISRQPIKVRR